MTGSLLILPVGAPDLELVDWLQQELEENFRIDCSVLQPLDPSFAYHPERKQYHSSEILHAMRDYVRRGCWRVLGITQMDLYVPILTFVFGEAEVGGKCAVVSYHRLEQGFYGLPPDRNLTAYRLLTEAVHELGHTMRLTHCRDHSCVMSSSHAVEWIDIKHHTFCRSCAAQATLGN